MQIFRTCRINPCPHILPCPNNLLSTFGYPASPPACIAPCGSPWNNHHSPIVCLPAKLLDLNASQQSIPKHFKKPSNHCKHQTTPPSPLAPPPKCARITSYFRPHPGGSVTPSPSLPLPPFNPVLMCTPDKYTQHNFCPP